MIFSLTNLNVQSYADGFSPRHDEIRAYPSHQAYAAQDNPANASQIGWDGKKMANAASGDNAITYAVLS